MPENKVYISQRVLDFVDSMRDVTGYDAVCRRIAQEIEALEYCYVSIFDVPKPGSSIKKAFLYNSRPSGYIDNYDRNNYVAIDPLVAAARHSLAPIAWSDLHLAALRKEQLKIMHEAQAFGVANGIVIPIVTAEGAVAVFSASGLAPNVNGSARSAIELIAVHSHQLLRRALMGREAPAQPPLLTRREREILTWVAAGKSDDEIACILNIQRATVTTHVNNSKFKLNTTRRTHAVVQALRLGEIAI